MAQRNSKRKPTKRKSNIRKFRRFNLQKVKSMKLAVMMMIILLAFAGLGVRLYAITRDNEVDYKKKILSRQRYDSKTLPFKRGNITDANGTILAVSEMVYNVVLDCKVMLDDEKNKEPTLSAMADCFGLSRSELNEYVENNPTSQYKIWKKRIPYEEVRAFQEREKQYNDDAEKQNKQITEKDRKLGLIQGVWFEEEYIRRYPNNSLACDVIGFTGTDNNGTYGLEEYYNDELNGMNGREYGFLNGDGVLERTTVAATDGNSLVTSIDANIQAICEKYLNQFGEEHKDEVREGGGMMNGGVIVMNPNNGDVLAMANYPSFDLNNPKDLTPYFTAEQIAQLKQEEKEYDALNNLWRNFCISDTYEPGSTAKAITLAAGLESGKIVGNETYSCGGALKISDRDISCNAIHGTVDVGGALEQSCNVAFMKMGEAIGAKTSVEFERIFNIGLRTNIDLAGEAKTALLVFTEQTMGPTQLATASFGQGYNVTMIEMACAFSSIINGGYYYEPHVVSRITNSNGDTIRNIEPRVLKQTISASTSEQMRHHLHMAVAQGTGRSARPAGYAIGGKTGTAEMVPRDKINYVVSFIGFAPADDPQIVIYCVIDRPNMQKQATASYATGIVKNILTEVLPYLHIAKTEEMTVAEQEEVDKILGDIVASDNADEEDSGTEGEEGDKSEDEGDSTGEGDTPQEGALTVDDNGNLIDAVTGIPVDPNYSMSDDPNLATEAIRENASSGTSSTGSIWSGSFPIRNILPENGESGNSVSGDNPSGNSPPDENPAE